MNERYKPSSRMNITSLVDVTFMLLIIFMIASPLIQGKIDLSLPKSKAAKHYEGERLKISLSTDKVVYIDEDPYSLEEFPKKLAKIKENREIKAVSFAADEEVTYGLVMKVIGEIKKVGISNLGLIAIPATEEK